MYSMQLISGDITNAPPPLRPTPQPRPSPSATYAFNPHNPRVDMGHPPASPHPAGRETSIYQDMIPNLKQLNFPG